MYARRRRLPLLAVVLVLVAAACGGGGDDGEVVEGTDVDTVVETVQDTGGETDGAPAEPEGFVASTARACSDLVNGIDHGVVVAGRDAALAVVEISMGAEATADELTALADALDAHLQVLVGLREQMAAIEPDAGDEEAWTTVVGATDSDISRLEHHVELARSGDAETVRAEFLPVDPGDPEAVEAALDSLGLAGRDCQVVYSIEGNDPAHEEFLSAAAAACTTIVTRRAVDGYSTDVMLDAMVAQNAGEPIEVTPELVAEAAATAAEWRQTAADFEAVPTDDVTDAAAWQDVLDATDERIEVFEQRLAALESGDAGEIEPLFTPGNVQYEHPALGDLEALGLERRDCRSIQG